MILPSNVPGRVREAQHGVSALVAVVYLRRGMGRLDCSEWLEDLGIYSPAR